MTLNDLLVVIKASNQHLHIYANGEELALTPRLTAMYGNREIEEIEVQTNVTLMIRVKNSVNHKSLITALNGPCGCA